MGFKMKGWSPFTMSTIGRHDLDRNRILMKAKKKHTDEKYAEEEKEFYTAKAEKKERKAEKKTRKGKTSQAQRKLKKARKYRDKAKEATGAEFARQAIDSEMDAYDRRKLNEKRFGIFNPSPFLKNDKDKKKKGEKKGKLAKGQKVDIGEATLEGVGGVVDVGFIKDLEKAQMKGAEAGGTWEAMKSLRKNPGFMPQKLGTSIATTTEGAYKGKNKKKAYTKTKGKTKKK